MEQIGNELKKILMAGMGAVTVTVEKSQQVIDALAKKGEITYEQAKALGADVAGKIKKAVDDSGIADMFSCKPNVQAIKNDLDGLTVQELNDLRAALDQIVQGKQEAEQGAKEGNAAQSADAAPDPPQDNA